MRLIAVRVTPALVDGTEDLAWIVGFHEGTGAVVNRLSGDRHIIGVHDAMDKAKT